MSLLIATSSFTLLAPPADDWGTAADPDAYTAVATVRGTLSGAAGVSDGTGNVVYQHKLTLDPCDLKEDMRVRDNGTGEEYAVIDVPRRSTLVPATVALVTRATASP